MIALDSLTLDGGALSAGLVAVAAVLALRRKKGAPPGFAAHSPQPARAAEEANRYYRAMVEHSWDTVVVADAMGVICFASDAVWRMFGITAKQAARPAPTCRPTWPPSCCTRRGLTCRASQRRACRCSRGLAP